jgi:hypothetical protein
VLLYPYTKSTHLPLSLSEAEVMPPCIIQGPECLCFALEKGLGRGLPLLRVGQSIQEGI